MTPPLQNGEFKIDRPSQIILGALRDSDWSYAGPLRDAADLDQNAQVFYRMEQYLSPAGFVEEQDRADQPPGYEEPRQFRLTAQGAEWVENHAAEIATPATRLETQQMARDAHDTAESAHSSVQSYRKKLYRLRQHVEDVDDELSELARSQTDDAALVSYVRKGTAQNRESIRDNDRTIDALREDIAARPTTDDLDDVQATLTDLDDDIDWLTYEQLTTEAKRDEVRGLSRPAIYLAAGALAAYLGLLGVVWVVASGLLATVLIAGIVAALGVVFGSATVVYICGWRSALYARADDDAPTPPAE